MNAVDEEVGLLLKKADESIRGARLLFEDGLFGFTVSRSYYAMFYLVTAVLLTKELNFSKHKAVISAFGADFVKTGIFDHKFHRYLVEAFERMQRGLHGQSGEITEETAQKSIDRA
ncbi:MAG: HEPN domain-containing protein, partial [Methanosarcinales archaeon]|nr:HEPN domain-containing protein [Methanosarcinales archaeon]